MWLELLAWLGDRQSSAPADVARTLERRFENIITLATPGGVRPRVNPSIPRSWVKYTQHLSNIRDVDRGASVRPSWLKEVLHENL